MFLTIYLFIYLFSFFPIWKLIISLFYTNVLALKYKKMHLMWHESPLKNDSPLKNELKFLIWTYDFHFWAFSKFVGKEGNVVKGA